VSALESLPLVERADIALGALPPNLLTVSDDDTGLGLRISPDATHAFNVQSLSDGPGGVSGHFFISGLDASPLRADLFAGFNIALTTFDLQLANGGLISSHIAGQLTIPYFTDNGSFKTVDVELGVKADGSLSLTLAAHQTDPASMTPDGLVKLTYNIGVGTTVELDVTSLKLDKSAVGVFEITISGRLAISSTGLNWPGFDFKALRIESNGHVSLDGGWIDLPDHTALDFFGFHVALQKLGFGSDNDGRWIGFSGDVHLIEGIPLGGSVRGLKINLDTGGVSFDGVGVSFEIPDVLQFSGEVDHLHAATQDDLRTAGLPDTLPTPTDVFAGDVHVVITAAGGLEVDATFIVGHFAGTSVFFLALDVELPVGIQIFLDVSLWGIHGFFASNLRPDPTLTGNTWWEWYKYPAPGGVPELGNPPDYTATDYQKWLSPRDGALALGAGVTIGTSADDGFTASAAVTLVLMLPGPVISLIGQANVLAKRVSGASADAAFQAMATYDGGAGTFDLVVSTHLSFLGVMDIEGTAELYVNAGSDPNTRGWYFALGLPPHDKRIRARILDLFESDCYFVISDSGLITGTYTGFNKSWDFGPLGVSLQAYIASLIAMQWSPIQVGGGLELHGEVHLEAFGIGLGITADALLEGCAPHPFWVHGEFSVELDTPWPLPNVGATVSLSWGGDDGSVPPAPLALSRVDALMLDHMAASDRYTLLAHHAVNPPPSGSGWPALSDPAGRPQSDSIIYDPATPGLLGMDPPNESAWHARVDGKDPLLIQPDANPPFTPPFAPVVPQDAHFTLSFAHPTNDAAGFANSAPPGQIQPNIEPVGLPTPQLPADDMSNINPTPRRCSGHIGTHCARWRYTNTSPALGSSSPPSRSSPVLLLGWASKVPGCPRKAPPTTRLMYRYPTACSKSCHSACCPAINSLLPGWAAGRHWARSSQIRDCSSIWPPARLNLARTASA
jgi:hypothetical protein